MKFIFEVDFFKLKNMLRFNLVLNVIFWTWLVIPHHVFLRIFGKVSFMIISGHVRLGNG